MRRFLLACVSAVILLSFASDARAAARRNVVLILTDDQGISDIGYSGSPHILTPNLDALAAQSVQFDTFYAHPMCSPTRAALMAGRQNPVILTRQDWLGGGLSDGDNGTFILQVAQAGTYRLTFHASQLLKGTRRVQIELGDQRIERVMLQSEIATRIETIRLEKGPTSFSAWMDVDGQRHGFERIEIKRLTTGSEP